MTRRSQSRVILLDSAFQHSDYELHFEYDETQEIDRSTMLAVLVNDISSGTER